MFKKNDLDYKLLRDLPEDKLEEVLTSIGLSLGKRLKIAKRIQESKYQSMLIEKKRLTKTDVVIILKEIDCVNILFFRS